MAHLKILGKRQLTKAFTFLVAQTVKSLPAIQETWVQSLGREEPLEEGNGNPL